MSCHAMGVMLQPEMVGGASVPGQLATQFADMVRNGCGEPMDRYVASRSNASLMSQPSALVEMLSKIEKMEIGASNNSPNSASMDENKTQYDAENTGAQTLAENAMQLSSMTIQAQRELVKSAVMFEGINSVRQGVSTLFQLQG